MGWSRGTVTETTITAYARVSLTSFGEVIHLEINQDIVEVTSTCLMPQLWSIGKNKRNIRRLGRNLNLLMENCSNEELQQTYMKASAEFIAGEWQGSRSGRFGSVVESASKISGFMSIFNPKPGYFITPILINLNIFYFFLIGLAGAGFAPYNLHGFEYFGANAADITQTHGQWWRLLSYQFMHEGFLHLIGNMFTLLMIGVYLEPLLGRTRFLLFYLICGMAGGLLSIYSHPFRWSVGASGSILGMYGVFLALLTTDLIEKHARKAILSTLLFFICLQLLAGLKETIDNSAHIGGLVTGFILGRIAISAVRTENISRTIKRLAAIAIIATLAFTFALRKMPNQPNRFRQHIDQFSRNEAMALRYTKMLGSASDEAIIREIQYQTLGFWKQNADVLDQLDQLSIGKSGHARVQQMRNFVFMQVKKASFELLWILHNRDVHGYVDSIQNCDYILDDMLQDLSSTPWTFQ